MSATDRAHVSEQFATVQQIAAALRALELDERQQAARVDLLTFQRTEIERANPQAGEDADLAAAKLVLSNAERLQRLSGDAYAALYESDEAAMTRIERGVEARRASSPRWTRASCRISSRARPSRRSSRISAFFLRGYADDIDASPGRLQEVEDRLAVLERLKKKYGPSLDEVLRHRESCARRARLARTNRRAHGRVEGASRGRAAVVPRGCQSAFIPAPCTRPRNSPRPSKASLAELAMSRTRFKVRFNETEPAEADWTARGIDTAEFFVSPNPGEELRPLARIASGGELSRIMLALRSLSPARRRRGTLIFDEVDAGIGGRAADDRRQKAPTAGAGNAGALHHALAADRGLRRHAFPGEQTGDRRPNRHLRHPARRSRARRGAGAHDGRRYTVQRRARQRGRIALKPAGER